MLSVLIACMFALWPLSLQSVEDSQMPHFKVRKSSQRIRVNQLKGGYLWNKTSSGSQKEQISAWYPENRSQTLQPQCLAAPVQFTFLKSKTPSWLTNGFFQKHQGNYKPVIYQEIFQYWNLCNWKTLNSRHYRLNQYKNSWARNQKAKRCMPYNPHVQSLHWAHSRVLLCPKQTS